MAPTPSSLTTSRCNWLVSPWHPKWPSPTMAFHPGLPERKWILSSARCSWNCRHSASQSPTLPSPGLPHVAGTFVPTSSPPPNRSPHPTAAQGGKEEDSAGEEQPSPGSSLPLVGYCSQMETVKPCQPQIHWGATSAFLGCVTARLHLWLDSITCQVPSVSPGLKPSLTHSQPLHLEHIFAVAV